MIWDLLLVWDLLLGQGVVLSRNDVIWDLLLVWDLLLGQGVGNDVLGSTSRMGSTSRLGVQPKSTVTVGPAAQKPFKSRPNHQNNIKSCLLYTSPSPRDRTRSRMPSSA